MFLVNLIIVVVLAYNNVLGDNDLCGFEDLDCLTKGAQQTYKDAKADHIVGPSSDPLHEDLIDFELPAVKYTLHNVTLHGMRTCYPALVKIEPKIPISYSYHVSCKHLKMVGRYEVKGTVGDIDIDGQGDFKVDYNDYVFLFSGDLEKYLDDNKKIHIHIQYFELNLDVEGNVDYEVENFITDVPEKADALHEYTVNNEEKIKEAFRKPVIAKFMSLFINHVNAYLRTLSVDEVFPN